MSLIGFNVETVDFRNLRFTIWDVGGKHKLRPLWKHYYLNTQGKQFSQLSFVAEPTTSFCFAIEAVISSFSS